MRLDQNQIDFAISYAGEDSEVAAQIDNRLRELGFNVFFAAKERHLLVSVDGESFFERLFHEAKEVIVLISQHYKHKEWPRYEWDIIRERDRVNRFIPVRLDDTRILGLPSKIICQPFTGDNYDEIVDTCVSRLLIFERESGIRRPTEYEQLLDVLRNDNKGALAQAYQLVKDQRARSPLSDCEVPESSFTPSYEIADTEWCNFSVVKRRSVKILVPTGLSQEELRFNLKHCAATQFNAYKPDAVMVCAYSRDAQGHSLDSGYTAGRAVFAPFGKWDKAQDGVAYNIPTKEFDYSIDFAKQYFNKT